MATLVVSCGTANVGRVCRADSVAGEAATSTIDSHGKARFRDLPAGRYRVSWGSSQRDVTMKDSDLSGGFKSLTSEDADYLEWLETPAETKLELVRAGDPRARWAVGVRVAT